MGSSNICFPVVYLVAGVSSRFGGKIKGLVPLGPDGETLIELSIKEALGAGFNEIIFVVSKKTFPEFNKAFGNEFAFNGKKFPIKYAFQEFDESSRDKPWGTCDAIVSAAPLIKSPFVVVNGDDIYGGHVFKLAFDALSSNNTCFSIGFELSRHLPKTGSVNRGILTVENGFIKDVVEHLNISRENLSEHNLALSSMCSSIFSGLDLNVLALLKERLILFKESHEGDRKSECYFPTELGFLLRNNLLSMKVIPVSSGIISLTNPGDEITATEQVKLLYGKK
jgi:choline kinase